MDGNGLIQPVDVALFVQVWIGSLNGGTLAGDFDGNGVVTPAGTASYINAWVATLSSGGC